MAFFDDELPLGLADFRKFAPALAARQADAADHARSAIGALMRTRAVVFGVDTVRSGEAERANQLVQIGIEAARKISNDPGVELSREDELGYEAVVRLTDRPALIVRNDSFPEPPPRWQRLDRPFRREIEAIIPSVGRIDVASGDGREMIGTGFVVSSDLVMTNTHVIEEFADPAPDNTSWSLKVGADPTIDFKAEHEVPKRKAFRITEVVTAFNRSDSDRLKSLDLALLRVEPLAFDPPGARLPDPVRLAKNEPAMTLVAGDPAAGAKDIYLIGYPWTDNDGLTPPATLAAIFGGITKMKRLQPGEYGANFASHIAFSHDSSTLGGNSGSFVVDLSANLVIGLHFRGKYKLNNYALQLWKLQDVPGVKDKGLNFVE